MTCIIGLIDGKNVWIGGDSAISEVEQCREVITPESKVYKKGGFIIGDSGGVRVAQILRYNLRIPKYTRTMDIYKYLSTKYNEAVRNCLRKYGQLTKDFDTELESMGGTFLIGAKTSNGPKVFQIDQDFAVNEIYANYICTGCGQEYAMGAMAAMENSKLPPDKKILRALEISERFSAFVRRPFVIDKI